MTIKPMNISEPADPEKELLEIPFDEALDDDLPPTDPLEAAQAAGL
jgi:hypothetical protein